MEERQAPPAPKPRNNKHGKPRRRNNDTLAKPRQAPPAYRCAMQASILTTHNKVVKGIQRSFVRGMQWRFTWDAMATRVIDGIIASEFEKAVA